MTALDRAIDEKPVDDKDVDAKDIPGGGNKKDYEDEDENDWRILEILWHGLHQQQAGIHHHPAEVSQWGGGKVRQEEGQQSDKHI